MGGSGVSFPVIAVLCLYALVMLSIGFYFWRKSRNAEQFFLGGRNMGPAVSALSTGASDMSSWLLMGLPGALYLTGVFDAWIAIGLTLGQLFNWLFISKRLRVYTGAVSGSMTMPDYFEARFADHTHTLRLISATVILVFFVFYVSSGFMAGAKLFQQILGVGYEQALFIGVSLVVGYTFFGGYLAICWTDLLQGTLMMMALMIVPVVMLSNIGGIDKSVEHIRHSDARGSSVISELKSLTSPGSLGFILSDVRSEDSASKLDRIDRLLGSAVNLPSLRGADRIHKAFKAELVGIRDGSLDTSKLQSVLTSLQGFVQDKHEPDHFSFLRNVSIVGLLSTLGWGLGYFGQPHIVTRFMSIRSAKDVPLATTICVSWMSISLAGACLVGLLGVAYVDKYDIDFRDPERIFIVMSQTLFNPWLAGVFLSALLAAIISTASSQLLVSSSAVAEDFFKKVIKKDATPGQIMFLSRGAVLATAIVALVLAMDENEMILSAVAYAWAGFGASFGSVMLCSLFWGRMTKAGAIAGMLVGALVVVIHKNFTYKYFGVYEIVPGFIFSCLAIVVFSLATKPSDESSRSFRSMLEEIDKS